MNFKSESISDGSGRILPEEDYIGQVRKIPMKVYNLQTNTGFPQANVPPRRCHSFPSRDVLYPQLENESEFVDALREGQLAKTVALRNRSRINFFCANCFLIAAIMLFWVLFKN